MTTKSYIFTVTAPKGQAITPGSVAAALEAAARTMEWHQPDTEPRHNKGDAEPGIPAWTLWRREVKP